MSQLTSFRPTDPTIELTRRATFQRPDLVTALADDGWLAFSERLGSLVGLRHGEHFRFDDEVAGR